MLSGRFGSVRVDFAPKLRLPDGHSVTAFREAFPILYVDDVPGGTAFYESALGFKTTYRWPAEGDALSRSSVSNHSASR